MPKRRRAPGEGSLYQRKKDGRWVASITLPAPPGAAQQRRTRYARTKTEAARKLEMMRAEIRDGYHTPERLTVNEHIREWFDEHKKAWKPATTHVYDRAIKKHIAPTLGKLRLKNLNAHAIRRSLTTIEETGGPAIARTTRTILHSACDWAVRTHMLPRNPVTPVRASPARPKEKTVWTPAEAASFLENARSTYLHALIYLLLTTGLRRGEALALHWGDLEDSRLAVRRTINRIGKRLEVGKPKSRKACRLVAIGPDTLAVLEQHRADLQATLSAAGGALGTSTPIFCDELGGYRRPSSVLRDFKRQCARAGVTTCTLHELRHWHASSLVDSGQDPVAVAARLGHSSAALTLSVYAHAFDRQREKTALSLSELGVNSGE